MLPKQIVIMRADVDTSKSATITSLRSPTRPRPSMRSHMGRRERRCPRGTPHQRRTVHTCIRAAPRQQIQLLKSASTRRPQGPPRHPNGNKQSRVHLDSRLEGRELSAQGNSLLPLQTETHNVSKRVGISGGYTSTYSKILQGKKS